MRKYKRLAEKASLVSERLKERYPDAECALKYGGDAWRLLVMARLSAQCKDETVNKVSVPLFEAFPDPFSMANGDIDEIERIVRSCGLFHTKAESIKAASRIICDKYGGQVPNTMEELLELPGVGRKIANLMMGDVFGGGGIVADTHCIRICARLGFYPEGKKDPLYTEQVMEQYIDKSDSSDFCHRIVLFGRDVCDAKAPRCERCPLSDLCDSFARKRKK